jgi:hypothetical protein
MRSFTPGTLFAALDAPTLFPQIATPSSASLAEIALAKGIAKSG